MKNIDIIKTLKNLFHTHFKELVTTVIPIQQSGSNRVYYRLISDNNTAIGAFNNNYKENQAFVYFSEIFANQNITVPKVLAHDLQQNIYLVQDLGNQNLFEILNKRETQNLLPQQIDLIKQILSELPKFQIQAHKSIDYSFCYPKSDFDIHAIMWDLNYFKYYFIKFNNIVFNDLRLEQDFEIFTKLLLNTNSDFFMYRDFQSRNIMLVNNKPYFIDYQGARKGPLQYDLASFLFQARLNLSTQDRELFLHYYIKEAQKYTSINKDNFIKHYYAFVLLRTLQVLGAYGYRGLYEKKSHFVQSIPFAINNLKWLIENNHIPEELTYLKQVCTKIINLPKFDFPPINEKLNIYISSFSYKKGIPEDFSGNGGGFVFDCRFLPNPGRKEEYKTLTGMDIEIIQFLENTPEVESSLKNVYSIANAAVANYKTRNFSNLAFNFGCTGGQHRSVFFAEKLATYIYDKFDVAITVFHREQNVKKTL